MDATIIKKAVRNKYGAIAGALSGGCGCSCSGDGHDPKQASKAVGYSDNQMSAVPEGANLGLGCGNPTALASLSSGETVLDLGSGAGFDCFLAAREVGETGFVIGVDMTPEMIDKARGNAANGGFRNVEFRLGEIENLPVADSAVDAIISNCVINLAPDKAAVFREAYRVLRPGGRIMVSDVVLKAPLPEALVGNMSALVGCVSGAITLDSYLAMIQEAGFGAAEVLEQKADQARIWAEAFLTQDMLDEMQITLEEAIDVADKVVSVSIRATR